MVAVAALPMLVAGGIVCGAAPCDAVSYGNRSGWLAKRCRRVDMLGREAETPARWHSMAASWLREVASNRVSWLETCWVNNERRGRRGYR